MDILVAVLAALIGYLLGSISFARVITAIAAPNTDISKIEQPVPNSDAVFESDSVSATAVRIHVGTRYGCLTALLDMLKVAIPTLAFKIWQPQTPYFLIVAAAGVVGHDWPIFHRFKGGRGESPIYGGLLVIDWVGALVTNLVGGLLGLVLGNLLILRWAGLVLLIPWFWFRTGDWAYLAYIIFINLVYWISMMPELKQAFDLQAEGEMPSQQELASFLGMGESLGRVLDRYSLPAVLSKLRHGKQE
jgi:glycerol-3-phosphate acyltransferase PlsY